jgi:26S proteasome regulatory subunit N5
MAQCRISRKISVGSFTDVAFHDLKLKYYELMIKLDQRESAYFEVCKCYKQVYDMPQIQNNILLMKEALKNIFIYLLLLPYTNEQ